MNTSWIAPAINAGASHINLLASSLWNQRMQRKQFEQEKSLQEDAQAFTTSERLAQQDYQTEMWNLQNAYDTPLAQMQRLRDAGINPNSIMSGNQVGSTGATPVSAPSGATSPMGHAPNMPYIDGAAINNSIVAGAEAAKLFEEAIGQRIENSYKGDVIATSLKQAESIISKNRQDIEESISRQHLNDAQTKQVYELLPILMTKNSAEVEQIKAITDKANAERDNLIEQKRLIDEEIKTEIKRQRNVDADTGLKQSAASLNAAQELLTGQQQIDVEKSQRLKDLEYQRGKIQKSYESAEAKYKRDLLERGIDPSKVEYGVYNPLGVALGIMSIFTKHRLNP